MDHEQRMVPPHQRTLDFARPDVWNQLPDADRHACQQLLSRFIYELFLSERSPEDEPRKD